MKIKSLLIIALLCVTACAENKNNDASWVQEETLTQLQELRKEL